MNREILDPEEMFERYFAGRKEVKPEVSREDAEHAFMCAWIIVCDAVIGEYKEKQSKMQ